MCIPLQSAIIFHLSSYLIPVLNLVVLIVALDDEAGYLASGFFGIPTRDTHITSDIHITVTASPFFAPRYLIYGNYNVPTLESDKAIRTWQ